jgi:hypothetical protein
MSEHPRHYIFPLHFHSCVSDDDPILVASETIQYLKPFKMRLPLNFPIEM